MDPDCETQNCSGVIAGSRVPVKISTCYPKLLTCVEETCHPLHKRGSCEESVELSVCLNVWLNHYVSANPEREPKQS